MAKVMDDKINIYIYNLIGRTVFLSFFFVCIITSNLYSQKITLQIKTSSNSIKYKKYHKDSLSIINELNDILTQYKKKGFAEISLDSLSFIDDICIANIHIGSKYSFGHFNIKNIDKVFLKKNGLKLNSLYKKKYSFTKHHEFLDKIISIYENEGQPFAILKTDSIIFDSLNYVHSYLSFNANKSIKINEIFFKGKYKISYKYLSQLTGLKKGGLYDNSKILKISQNLINTNFISEIKPPAIDFYENKADVYVYLNSKKANNFSGVLGFAPDKDNDDKLVFTGDINIKLLNAFGTGEVVDFKWKSLGEGSQELNMKFSYPYLFSSNFGIKTNAFIEKIDSTLLNVNFSGGINYFFSSYDYISFGYSQKKSLIIKPELIDTTLFVNSTISLFGLEYNLIKFDNILNPYKGFSFLGAVNNGKRLINDKTSNFFNTKFEFSVFIPLFRQLTYKFSSINNYNFNSEVLFENELYRIGGFRLLRGFDEQEIQASSYSVFSNELRFLFDKNSNLFIFMDMAYVQQKSVSSNVVDIPMGVGAGINLETKAGIFSLAYALGKSSGRNFNINSSKIHIGYYSIF